MANDAVNQALSTIAAEAANAVEFAKAQIPDVIQQLIVWKTAEYAASVVVFSAGAIYLYRLFKKAHEASQETYDDGPMFGMVATGIVGLGCSLGAVLNAFALLKIYLAPKVWLLQYAASLVTGK